MSYLIAASLLPLDTQLSADLTRIAVAEGLSVLDLCAMVGERLERARRLSPTGLDQQEALTAALRRLVASYSVEASEQVH